LIQRTTAPRRKTIRQMPYI